MSNPYVEISPEALYSALQTRAGDLLTRRIRTTEERARLAQDSAMLMLAVSRYVGVGAHTPESPEKALESGVTSIADAYGAWYRVRTCDLRWQVLRRAAGYLLGGRAERWLQEEFLTRAGVADPTGSDEGLIAALNTLDDGVRR